MDRTDTIISENSARVNREIT